MYKRKLLLLTYLLLGLYVIFQVLNITRLEFRTEELVQKVRNISFISFLVLLILLAIGTRKNHSGPIMLFSIIVVILIVCAYWIFVSIPIPGQMKIYHDGEVLFVRKKNPDCRIIQQVYYSGLTGSNPNYLMVQTQNITPNIRWTKNVDTNSIDTSVWLRILPHNYRR